MSEIDLKIITPVRFPPPASEPDEIASIRKDMLRFAMSQLRNADEAEDAVQEALAAAFANVGSFKKESKLKTWVFSILSNKIKDIIKKRSRLKHAQIDEVVDELQDDLFEDSGDWCEASSASHWDTPERSFSNQQFWTIFEACLNRLPENTSRVFMMREILGLEKDEICDELGISGNNCSQILFRARLGLSVCLDEKWFKGEGKLIEP